MSDTDLGPLVTLQGRRLDGSIELILLPAMIAGWMLIDPLEHKDYASMRVLRVQPDEFRIERSMTEWVRSV